MESIIEKLPMILAVLLGISEALAHIPALKSNSILEILTSIFKKAKPVADSLAEKQASRMATEEEKKELEAKSDAE